MFDMNSADTGATTMLELIEFIQTADDGLALVKDGKGRDLVVE
jgi:hypothetical protein